MRAMEAGAWDEARAKKRAVEQGERVERRRRERDGERWTPNIFQWDPAAETWTLKEKSEEELGDDSRRGEGEREPLRAPPLLVEDGAASDRMRAGASASASA